MSAMISLSLRDAPVGMESVSYTHLAIVCAFALSAGPLTWTGLFPFLIASVSFSNSPDFRMMSVKFILCSLIVLLSNFYIKNPASSA